MSIGFLGFLVVSTTLVSVVFPFLSFFLCKIRYHMEQVIEDEQTVRFAEEKEG